MLFAAAVGQFIAVTEAVFSATASNSANVFGAVASFGVTQPSGTAGCSSETGTSGACTDASGLDAANGVAVSPDGAHVYLASELSDAVAVFSRNATSGALTQLSGTSGCISETGTAGACTDGKGLDGAFGVAVSPDGAHVYVTAGVSDAVAVFSRNATSGALTQLSGTSGCISETGTAGACTDGKALDDVNGIAISPDGDHLYSAADAADAVAVFSRNSTSGALTQLSGTSGCISETGTAGACTDGTALDAPVSLTVSPDGAHLYSTANNSDAVAVFSRNATSGALTQLSGTSGCISETGTSGACTDGKSLGSAWDVAVSPDGDHVYVTASGTSDAVAVFSRNSTSGALTQLSGTSGCISETGTAGACTDGTALDGAHGVAVSPDGQNVYATAFTSDALVILFRDTSTGALTQLSSTRGCISETGTSGACTDGKALDGAYSVTVPPDGKDVYVASQNSDAVAILSRTR